MLVIFILLLSLVWKGALWKLLEKAGEPGWMALVPVLNFILFLNIIERPIWWTLLLFVPVLNLFVLIQICKDLTKRYACPSYFTVGLFLLPVLFIPIMAYRSTHYRTVVRMRLV